MKTLAVLLLAAAPLLAQDAVPAGGAAAAAADAPPGLWRQWRGPERSGHCPGRPWPERLSQESLTLQWRVPLGPSYSGPIVDRERVYTTETLERREEVVRAFDRRTGKEIWQQRWTGAVKVPFFAARNGSWIRATPALDAGGLYVAGMRDVLVCLEAATGKERWRVDFVERYAAPVPAFGFVCSPLVHGDHVYVQAGASFVKLDKRNGETVWRTLEDEGGMWGSAFSSPVRASLGGMEQILVQTRAALCGIDEASGETLWTMPVKSFRGMNILTPQPWGDGVFTSAYGGRGHFFAVAKGDGKLAVEERWDSRAQGYMTSPVVIDGHAYLYLRSQRFTCVDLATGTTKWTSEPIRDNYWSLVAQGHRILALTDGGELYLIAANPERFEVIDRLAVSEKETWAHLAVDGEQVFVRELDGLAAHAWR